MRRTGQLPRNFRRFGAGAPGRAPSRVEPSSPEPPPAPPPAALRRPDRLRAPLRSDDRSPWRAERASPLLGPRSFARGRPRSSPKKSSASRSSAKRSPATRSSAERSALRSSPRSSNRALGWRFSPATGAVAGSVRRAPPSAAASAAPPRSVFASASLGAGPASWRRVSEDATFAPKNRRSGDICALRRACCWRNRARAAATVSRGLSVCGRGSGVPDALAGVIASDVAALSGRGGGAVRDAGSVGRGGAGRGGVGFCGGCCVCVARRGGGPSRRRSRAPSETAAARSSAPNEGSRRGCVASPAETGRDGVAGSRFRGDDGRGRAGRTSSNSSRETPPSRPKSLFFLSVIAPP